MHDGSTPRRATANPLASGLGGEAAGVMADSGLLVVLIGQRKALAMAVRNNKPEHRFSGLLARLTT